MWQKSVLQALATIRESTFRLLNLLDRNNLNIDVMIQSLGKDGTKSVSFTVAKPDMLRTIDVLNDNKDLLGIKKLDYDENVAKVSVIGAGVRSIQAWLPKCSARSPMQESIPRWLPPRKSASLP